MNEIWKDIPGFEGYYQASNLGSIRSMDRIVLTKAGFHIKLRGRVLKNYTTEGGYLGIGLSKEGIRSKHSVHSLVCQAFFKHKPCGLELVVNHKNFVRTDNRVDNLEIITNRENSSQKHIPSFSQYVGVVKSSKGKPYRAAITINGKYTHLGMFKTEKEASHAYESAVMSLKKGEKIKIYNAVYTSPHTGVYYDKIKNKWKSYVRRNGKQIHVGSFNTEIAATKARNLKHELIARKEAKNV